MSLANPATHTTALVAKLQTADIVTGDADRPTVKHGWQGTPMASTFIPYCMVWPLDTVLDGSLGAPDDDAEFRWQVTCIADTRLACETLVHAVNTALVGETLTVSGRTVPRIRPDGGGAVTPENEPPPSRVRKYVAMPRYAAWSH